MKRLIKTTLCIVMILSMAFPTISSAAEASPAQTEDYAFDIAFGLLEALDIVNSTYSASNEAISKAEFTGLLGKALGIDVNTVQKAFAEVGKNGKITQSEVCGPLLDILGYKDWLKLQKIDSRVYVKRISLISNPMGSEYISRIEAVKIIYNMLHTNRLERTSYGDSPYGYAEADNCIKAYYKLEVVEDVLSANEYVSVFSNISPAGNGTVKIGDKDYKYSAECGDLLGRMVVAYVDKEYGKLIYVHEKNRDDVAEFASEDIIGISGNKIEYENDGRVMTAELSQAMLALNGIADFSLIDSEIATMLKGLQNSKIRLVKREKSAYSTVIAEQYTDAVIKSFDSKGEKAYGSSALSAVSIPCVPQNDTKLVYIYTEDGKTVLTPNDLTAGAVVSYFLSADNNVCKIYVCSSTVNGKISSISKSNTTKVKIGEQSYNSADVFIDGRAPRVGDEGTYKMNVFGKIVAVDKLKSECEYGYAYLAAKDTDAFGTEVRMKVYASGGKHIEAKLAKKVRLNGGSGKTPEEVFNAMCESSSFKPQLIRYKLNTAGEINFVDLAATDAGSRENDDSLYVQATEAWRSYYEDWNLESWTFGADDTEDSNVKSVYPLSTETEMFMVYQDRLLTVESAENFNWYMLSNSKRPTAGASYNVEIYKTNAESGFCEFVVVKQNEGGGWSQTTKPRLVNDIRVVYDEKHRTSHKTLQTLSLEQTGETVEYMLDDSISLRKVDWTNVTIPSADIESYIQPGDIIQTTMGTDGLSHAVRIVYDYSEDQVCWGWQNSDGSKKSSYEYRFASAPWTQTIDSTKLFYGSYGYVSDKWIYSDNTAQGVSNDSAVRSFVSVSDNTTLGTQDAGTMTELYAIPKWTGYFRCAIFDPSRKENKAYYGIISDITDFKATSGNDFDYMFTYWGKAKSAMTGFVFYKR